MYFFLQQRLKFSVNNTFSFSFIREMKAISKPHLVDLLRMFDQKKWITPRIRYASVRSKGELLEDLERHFKSFVYGGVVTFVPKYRVDFLPKLEYNLKERAYYLDGEKKDFPRESRSPPKFVVHKKNGGGKRWGRTS